MLGNLTGRRRLINQDKAGRQAGHPTGCPILLLPSDRVVDQLVEEPGRVKMALQRDPLSVSYGPQDRRGTRLVNGVLIQVLRDQRRREAVQVLGQSPEPGRVRVGCVSASFHSQT